MAKKKQKYYVVWQGRKQGVFTTWADCEAQIKGFNGAKYKSFLTLNEAENAFKGKSNDYIGKNVPKKIQLSPLEQKNIGTPIWNSLAVDAACSGNPGVLEYQGVDTTSGRRLFKGGPYLEGTVNIGEFLALVHGLAYLKNINSTIPIYSDSKTAMAWVRNKQIRTNLVRKPTTEGLFKLVDRALVWLNKNKYTTKVLKWETKAWGEIPADFGRK